jgi:hypothetical protein
MVVAAEDTSNDHLVWEARHSLEVLHLADTHKVATLHTITKVTVLLVQAELVDISAVIEAATEDQELL